MPAQQIIFALVTFLHDLFTAVWIGGLITLGLTVLPSAKKVLGMGPETKKLMDAIQKRLSVLVYVSIAVLAVTGALQANRNPAFEGLLSFRNPYSVVLSLKHLLMLGMVAVTLVRSLALGRRAVHLSPSQEKLKAGLLVGNIVLGVGILLLTGFVAALAAGVRPG